MKRGFWTLQFYWQEADRENLSPANTYYTLWKRKKKKEVRPRVQMAKLKTWITTSRLGPYWCCPSGFQNCYEPVMPLGLPFSPLRNKNVYRSYLVSDPPLYFRWWGRWVSREKWKWVNSRSYAQGRNPIYTWTWLRWWRSGVQDDTVIEWDMSRPWEAVSVLNLLKGWEPLQAGGQTVAASLPLLGVTPPWCNLPHWTRADMQDQQWTVEATVSQFCTCGFHPVVLSCSRITHSRKPCCEQPYGERGPWGEWEKFPASRHMGTRWKYMIQTRSDYRWWQPQPTLIPQPCETSWTRT